MSARAPTSRAQQNKYENTLRCFLLTQRVEAQDQEQVGYEEIYIEDGLQE
jgi:hypothetical protein